MKPKTIVIMTLIACGSFSVFSAQKAFFKPLPLKFAMSGFAGVSAAYIEADGLQEKYFAPTSSSKEVIGFPFGIEIEALYNNYIGLAFGLRRHHFGQNTTQQKVMFADDIFIHDFQSIAEVDYLGGVVLLKGGFSMPNFWAYLRIGAVGLSKWSSRLEWQIDGHAATPGSNRMPAVTLRERASSYLGGFETGLRFDRNGFFLIGDCLYGRTPFVSKGLPGTAYHRAAEVSIGYRRFLSVY